MHLSQSLLGASAHVPGCSVQYVNSTYFTMHPGTCVENITVHSPWAKRETLAPVHSKNQISDSPWYEADVPWKVLFRATHFNVHTCRKTSFTVNCENMDTCHTKSCALRFPTHVNMDKCTDKFLRVRHGKNGHAFHQNWFSITRVKIGHVRNKFCTVRKMSKWDTCIIKFLQYDTLI